MNLKTVLYTAQERRMPTAGKQVIAQFDTEQVVVYQAYKSSIASYARLHNKLGGNDYRFTRMSWIKPNFLWMMYRCGWASKPDQESVLAIWLRRNYFEQILATAVHSSFNPTREESREKWQQQLADSDVCLQWDPDHDPYGNKLVRRAIQLGLRGETLRNFANDWITEIQDITPFVIEQRKCLENRRLEELIVPEEGIYPISQTAILENLGIF